MNSHEQASQTPRCEDLAIGWNAVEAIRSRLGSELPSGDSVMAYYPPTYWFIDSDAALKKDEAHGISHVARTIITGAFIIPYIREHLGYPFLRERVILESLRRHDVRVGDGVKYEDHAQAAAEFFNNPEMHNEIDDIWKDVQYIISHHIEKPNISGSHNTHPHLLFERQIMQDLDASDLTRNGVNKPIGAIRICSEPVKNLQLPNIMQLLRTRADVIHTGDAFKDHILAAVRLGLLRQ